MTQRQAPAHSAPPAATRAATAPTRAARADNDDIA